MALEISIWENSPIAGTEPKPLASTVIPLRSAILHHIDWWPLLAPNSNFTKATSMEYICNIKNVLKKLKQNFLIS
jgi:hypothetical protein